MSSSTTERPRSADPSKRTKTLIGLTILLAALVTVGVALLLINIMERQQEGEEQFFRVADIDERTVDPAIWGQNFPLQYDSYKSTEQMETTQHGGSEALPHEPSAQDPRTVVTEQKIEVDPRLVQMWKGYAFSVDYREKRGHAYMLLDQRTTRRVTEFKQPGACLNCHASMPTIYADLGKGDVNKGFAELNKMSYTDATKLAEHPISCLDCHDPKSMELRITRPAFVEGIKQYKASVGVQDFDVNEDATAQEMRTYVCAQCHVEYAFPGEGKTLTYPWKYGLSVRDEERYWNETGWNDWTHELTGAKMLKAQHPEFELYSQGVHSRAGVSCADCHMPYEREGGMKVSNHQVRSPMLNVNNSCQTCHNTTEQELKDRVGQIQDRHLHTRNQASQALDELITDLEKAVKEKSASPENIEVARNYQRKASFYIDWIVSENSNGFHAPGEALRVLNDANEAARKGQLALRGVITPDTPAEGPAAAESTPNPTATN
ncbi:ammonia-forming cytochrome c nitrite reductase subunit c552 [Mobilicoccus caccae]|uniref:nitrite reductase (cytochrome; ammonia-forming) n=1 Tax=Mobilicoccus caccae TaxID=1859295 RepID=A0ABQ6IXT1_9MICO|nr:ammonia-forming cytochrome c nitrite reductase subunit c552 [Mobilicoccus caccae]GMA42319.1 cytochrome c-552 [Mobilicoccus caccae]